MIGAQQGWHPRTPRGLSPTIRMGVELRYFFVFNPTLSRKEETEHEKVYHFFSGGDTVIWLTTCDRFCFFTLIRHLWMRNALMWGSLKP